MCNRRGRLRVKVGPCSFNGLAISYTGSPAHSPDWPTISKGTRGQDFVAQVQQLWSSFLAIKTLRGKRILLVDDKDLHVHLETKLFNKERAVTTRFRDGTELVEAVVKLMSEGVDWPWDAVVLDQTMETLDGLPALQLLPSAFKDQVPITMYSTEDSKLEQYLAAGAVGYMEKKPGSHKRLVARVGELVKSKEVDEGRVPS